MNKRERYAMDILKRFFCLGLCLCLGVGCSPALAGSSAPASSLSAEDAGDAAVSGIITAVNGNEVTLDLVTLAGGMVPGSSSLGEAPGSGEIPDPGGMPQAPSGEKDAGDAASAPRSPGGRGSGGGQSGGEPAGTSSQPGGQGSGGGSGYRRTGKTAVYQIPVGAPVTTLAGATKDFNSLAIDTLITITLEEREDGTLRPTAVRVLQSV